MKKKFFLLSPVVALVFAAASTSSFAGMGADEVFNIYGWQNWSYEYIEADRKNPRSNREYDRLSNNAANIGFMAHMDTGIDGLQVGFRCEQFTYWGRNNIYTDWCNRNSKLSLRHETAGELMVGQWLLPFNEIVAAWVDPFYDAGADSHTSIMGNIGGAAHDNAGGGYLSSLFYNGSFDDAFTAAYGALAFNRRQEGVVQYVWPNLSAMASQARDGFQFRFAVTEGSDTDTRVGVDTTNRNGIATVDPRIWSTGASYQHNMANGGQIWAAVAYEKHEDISATAGLSDDDVGICTDSDDDAWRVAARYRHSWGDGQMTQIAGMYEELEYDATCRDTNGNPLTALNAGDAPVAAWTGVERDAWMVSGKHAFGNGFDVRFSYMDGDEWDCKKASACLPAHENNTDAQAWNLGVFYTLPAGTELRLTYSEVDNEANAGYDFGINSAAAGGSAGEDITMFAVGIVHWFD